MSKPLGSPEVIGLKVKKLIKEVVNLHCSIGISGNKTTAKVAANHQKPHGFTIIPPWQMKAFLAPKKVNVICGIGKGVRNFLARYGVYYCGDMEKLPMSILSKRFGDIGRKLWHQCQGLDWNDLQTIIPEPKSMSHGKIMPPQTKDKSIILTYLLHMCEKLGGRLRRNNYQAQTFLLRLKSHEGKGIKTVIKLAIPTCDGQSLYAVCYQAWYQSWQGESFYQINITALAPHQSLTQYDLFNKPDSRKQKINAVVDEVNQKYGEFKIAPLRILKRSNMPNVIAPSWKPQGYRQTIED